MGLMSGPPLTERSTLGTGVVGGSGQWGPGASELYPRRLPMATGRPLVTADTGLKHSAVWACIRLRNDLISTLPIDVFRKVNLGNGPVQVECPVPSVLVTPGGVEGSITGPSVPQILWPEWCYSSGVELDRTGNSIGLIREKDGNGMPVRIDLQASSDCGFRGVGSQITKYRIGNKWYDPPDIWHERQFTVSGIPIGLSPIMYAATAIGQYMAVEEFATEWFASGAIPRARLKNTARTIPPGEAQKVKDAWRASLAFGEPFVHGSDWEYDMLQAQAASNDWIEAKNFSINDIGRFFGVPGDLIDAVMKSGTRITYQNITQRNLQFLIMHLGPSIIRREKSLSCLLLRPRYVKLNTDAILRMDPATRAAMLKTQIDSRILAPSEARELDNRPPFTESQLKEFDRFWPPKVSPPIGGQGGSPLTSGPNDLPNSPDEGAPDDATGGEPQ
jgi:HK97 family phage portal protein